MAVREDAQPYRFEITPPFGPTVRYSEPHFSLGPCCVAESILCCFWDLETTGLCVSSDDILQIGSTCRLYERGRFVIPPGGRPLDFSVYVRSDSTRVPSHITELTGINDRLLGEKGVCFRVALEKWKQWLQGLLEHCGKSTVIWLVAHNGNQFDLPLLLHQEMNLLRWHPGTFFTQAKVSAVVDTLILSRALARASTDGNGESHKLADLYIRQTKTHMPCEHNAFWDAKALLCIVSTGRFSLAWRQCLIGWSFEEYLRAFYKAFSHDTNCVFLDRALRAPELKVNRCLFEISRLTRSTEKALPLSAISLQASNLQRRTPAAELWESFRLRIK